MNIAVNNGFVRSPDEESPGPKGPNGVTTLKRAFSGVIRAERAELHSAAAGLVFAAKDVTVERGGARDIVAGDEVRLTQAGAGMILAGGDASLRQSGAGMVFSLGDVNVEQGGACFVAARRATVGRGGLALLAITPRLEVAEGGRVLGRPAIALAALVAASLGFAAARLMHWRRA
jgi:hypothetical protein